MGLAVPSFGISESKVQGTLYSIQQFNDTDIFFHYSTGRENQLVALIPDSDQRLRPSRT